MQSCQTHAWLNESADREVDGVQDESSHESYGECRADIFLLHIFVGAFLQSFDLVSLSLLESHENVVGYEDHGHDHLHHVVDLEEKQSLLGILPHVLASVQDSGKSAGVLSIFLIGLVLSGSERILKVIASAAAFEIRF